MADEEEAVSEHIDDAGMTEAQARTELGNQLRDFLQNARPASIRVVGRDGKVVPISLKLGKSRWTIAARVVSKMLDDVDRVELLDKAKSITDIWQAPDLDPEERARERAAEREKELEANTPNNLKPTLALARLVDEQATKRVNEIRAGEREYRDFALRTLNTMAARIEAIEKGWGNVMTMLYETTAQRAEMAGLIQSGALKPVGADGQADNPADALMMQLIAQKLGLQLPAPHGAPQLPAAAAPTAPTVGEVVDDLLNGNAKH